MLALLCDFGQDRPEQVVRMILQNLLKIVGRVERLKKYQRQLQVLSRLRKLQPIVTKEISLMPIQFDVETDELYLEGIEKGIEKQRHESVVNLIRLGKLSVEEIAVVSAVSVEYVRNIQKEMGTTPKRDN